MSTPILQIKNLNKVFKQDLFKAKHHALIDVNCSFETGTATAIIGHNGAGKTTSLRSILGLLRPDRGEVLFKGHPISNEDRRYIGYMPETNKLPSELRAEELLYFHLNLYKPQLNSREKRERVQKKLSDVGLHKQHREARIHELSKGLGRRLAWAMASIHDPELLILDEPFTGMDPLGRKDLSGWIQNSVQKGVTVIMTTHDLLSARTLCTQILAFREGRIVYEGTSEIPEEQILSFFKGAL